MRRRSCRRSAHARANADVVHAVLCTPLTAREFVRRIVQPRAPHLIKRLRKAAANLAPVPSRSVFFVSWLL